MWASLSRSGLFLVALLIWMYAFGVGVVRSARGEDVGVGNLFFLQGSAPRDVRIHLFSALGLSVVLAFATVYGNAFAALEPMFPLALISLWGARYGTFPAAPTCPGAVRTRERKRKARRDRHRERAHQG